MADTAFQTQYRDEFVASFEQRQSLLRGTCVTEAQIKGSSCVFLVAGSGDADAVTRGVNGMIPARADDLTQNTCSLTEWHDLVRKTNYNVFASQGDQRAIMQQSTMGVINRKIDQQIITELNTGTNDTGAAVTASLNLFTKAKVILGNNKVPWDGWITLLGTPAFFGYLLQAPEFSNVQYVNQKPMESGPDWRDQPVMYRWRNVVMIEHPELPGVGTSAEKCFLYHRNSIGHAADTKGMQTPVGYDEEQDYSWARASMYMGAKLLQNSGVVVINHDGSAFVAS
jgi:hypothetical protein